MMQENSTCEPPLLQKRTLHTAVPLATGVVHPPSRRLTTAERHCRQLLEITAKLLDVAVRKSKFGILVNMLQCILIIISIFWVNYPSFSNRLKSHKCTNYKVTKLENPVQIY